MDTFCHDYILPLTVMTESGSYYSIESVNDMLPFHHLRALDVCTHYTATVEVHVHKYSRMWIAGYGSK